MLRKALIQSIPSCLSKLDIYVFCATQGEAVMAQRLTTQATFGGRAIRGVDDVPFKNFLLVNIIPGCPLSPLAWAHHFAN